MGLFANIGSIYAFCEKNGYFMLHWYKVPLNINRIFGDILHLTAREKCTIWKVFLPHGSTKLRMFQEKIIVTILGKSKRRGDVSVKQSGAK